MSQTILANDNLVEIIFTRAAAWQTVDLTSYLNHSDPKAVAIHVINTRASGSPPYGYLTGVRPVGSAIPDAHSQRQLGDSDQGQWPVVLNASNEIQVWSNTAWVKFYVHAEFGGPDFVAFSDAQQVPNGPAGQWVTQDSTILYGADAGSVIASLVWVLWSNAGNWGLKDFGSPNNWHPNNVSWGGTFDIVGIDSEDRFETWQSQSAGKSPVLQVWFYEVGYFKRRWTSIFNPVDRGLTTVGAWTDEDITDATSEDASIALIKIKNSDAAVYYQAWARNDGGSEPTKLTIPQKSIHLLVNLTDEQVYEYYIENLVVDNYIIGWFEPRLAAFRSGAVRVEEMEPILVFDSDRTRRILEDERDFMDLILTVIKGDLL